MMMGNTMQARVRLPDNMEVPKSKKMTKSPSPKSPNTMEGTPAKVTIANRIMDVNLFSRAYSDK